MSTHPPVDLSLMKTCMTTKWWGLTFSHLQPISTQLSSHRKRQLHREVWKRGKEESSKVGLGIEKRPVAMRKPSGSQRRGKSHMLRSKEKCFVEN